MKIIPTISEIERDHQEVEKLITQITRIIYKYEKGINQSLEEYTKDTINSLIEIFDDIKEDNLVGVIDVS